MITEVKKQIVFIIIYFVCVNTRALPFVRACVCVCVFVCTSRPVDGVTSSAPLG